MHCHPRNQDCIQAGELVLRAMSHLFYFCLLFSLLAYATTAQSQDGKVDSLIRYHEDRKAALAEQGIEAMLAARLDASHPDSEECVLYVTKRLSPSVLQGWKRQGLELDAELYIAPIAGKHPLGFHMAVIPYRMLEEIADHPLVIRIQSVETPMEPHNDVGRSIVNIDPVQSGTIFPARSGAGVKLAIADTGMDTGHIDLPTPVEAYDVTDGPDPFSWGSGIANFAVGHGTHVVGTAVGSGQASGGLYRGAAPSADLYFYKIGNDFTGLTTEANMIKAVNRATVVGADVFNMSFGGWTTFLDGSGPICQAIDVATAAGTTCVISAGNAADDSMHDAAIVAPGSTESTITYTIDNTNNPAPYVTSQWLQVIWKDDNPNDQNVLVSCTNLGPTEFLFPWNSGTSTRGTEMKGMMFWINVAAGQTKTYDIKVWNVAPSGATAKVQFYRWEGKGFFNSPDISHTTHSPSIADTALSVGAWAHRSSWTDSSGNVQTDPTLTVNSVAPFSSHGPRIDGLQKPDVIAPAAAMISTRDQLMHTDPTRMIANGVGTGADYYIDRGTSMGAPLIAGGLCLLLEHEPSLTPDQMRLALTLTASNGTTPDTIVGHGIPDFLSMIQSLAPSPTLNSITPNSADAGSRSMPIILSGSDFTPNSAVEWNGSVIATTFVDATNLTATVTTAQLVTGGTVNVQVRNTVTQATSTPAPFTVNPVALTNAGSGLATLSILGAVGGADRRVDIDVAEYFDITMAASAVSSGTFLLFARTGVPAPSEVFVYPGVVGDMAFHPCLVVPGTTTHFTVASSLPSNPTCPAIANDVFAPWQMTVPGIPFPVRFTIQGVEESSGIFAFTNGIIINVR